jgi:putative tricarboxylic transport membrane protein
MTLNDRIIGLAAIAGGAAMIWGTLGFRDVPGQLYGSAFFPQIVGSVLMLTGAALILTAPRGQPLVQLSPLLRGQAAARCAAVVAAVVGWLWLAPQAGFLLSTGALIAGLALVAGARVVPAVLTAVAMAAVLFVVFGSLLRVPLPRGLIEGFL